MKILLLHGLFGSPSEMANLGESLSEIGFECHIPLLPGHENPKSLRNITIKDYYDCMDQLFEINDYTVVIGHSMGGLLATYATSKFSGVEKCILVSTPLKVNIFQSFGALILNKITPNMILPTQDPEKIFAKKRISKKPQKP